MVKNKAMQVLEGMPEGPVLVIAPHNDDEVLGAGGVLQRHVHWGDRVTVVLLTNGDGQYRGPFKNRTQAIRFGYRRQEETRRALAHLGIPEDQILFLGYPDRGLAQLWDSHWDPTRVYTSPQTRLDHSPYENSFTPRAPYCGLAVVKDLKKVLKTVRPRTIYLPHPHDLHPDHWSAHAFTLYALESLKLEHPEDSSIRLFSYLVHYGRWPRPRGKFIDAPLRLPRPLIDLDARWWSVPLTRQETLKKYQAILCYRSQVRYMRLYLASFARRNELFCEIPTLTLRGTVGFDGTEDGFLNSRGLKSVSVEEYPVLRYFDPQHRSLLKNLQGHNNGVKAVRLAIAEEDRLAIEVEFFRPFRSPHEVLVHLKTIGAEDEAPVTWRFIKRDGEIHLNERTLPEGPLTHRVGQRAFSLSLPLEVLGDPKAFLIGVELRRKGITFAKSAYRLVELSRSPFQMPGQSSMGSVERTICTPASANR
jgi:LmbE family N-acetylglucosaminyl deacetylase